MVVPAFESYSVLQRWASGVKRELGLETFDVWMDDGSLRVGRLKVPESKRGKGIGSAAMRAVCDYADSHGLAVTLTPDAYGFVGVLSARAVSATRRRLTAFYSRFGFVTAGSGMRRVHTA